MSTNLMCITHVGKLGMGVKEAIGVLKSINIGTGKPVIGE